MRNINQPVREMTDAERQERQQSQVVSSKPSGDIIKVLHRYISDEPYIDLTLDKDEVLKSELDGIKDILIHSSLVQTRLAVEINSKIDALKDLLDEIAILQENPNREKTYETLYPLVRHYIRYLSFRLEEAKAVNNSL